jgi:hypothetical protein
MRCWSSLIGAFTRSMALQRSGDLRSQLPTFTPRLLTKDPLATLSSERQAAHQAVHSRSSLVPTVALIARLSLVDFVMA